MISFRSNVWALALLLITCVHAKTYNFDTGVTAVAICAPLNVVFVPSSDSTTTVTVSDNVASALGVTADQDGLVITLAKPLKLDTVAKVEVSLPPFDSLSVYLSGVGGAIFPGGFAPSSLTLGATGTAMIYATNLTVGDVVVSAAGAAMVVLDGEIETVTMEAAGTSQVWVGGLATSANIALAGTASSYFDPADDTATIQGTVVGTSSNSYTRGSCSVSATDVATPCKLTKSFSPPAFPTWSCVVSRDRPSPECVAPAMAGRKLLAALEQAGGRKLRTTITIEDSTGTSTINGQPVGAGTTVVFENGSTSSSSTKSTSSSSTTTTTTSNGSSTTTTTTTTGSASSCKSPPSDLVIALP